MVNYGQQGVKKLDASRYTHAFTSKYGKVRIFKVRSVSKKSKDWVADPANKLCDAPGSWYCVGQYPPAIQWLIAKRKPFKQLEDFNVKTTKEDEEYQEEYHKRMSGRGGGVHWLLRRGEEPGRRPRVHGRPLRDIRLARTRLCCAVGQEVLCHRAGRRRRPRLRLRRAA